MDLTFGWGKFLGAVAGIVETKILRAHSDKYLSLEQALLKEMQKPYDNMDDFKIAAIKAEMKLVRDAFERDMVLAGK